MALALTGSRRGGLATCALGLACACSPSGAPPEPDAALVVGERIEWVHPGAQHAVHVSPASLAVGTDGVPQLAWVRSDDAGRSVWLARVEDGAEPLRVDPSAQPPASEHQAPGLAVAPDGGVYVSWSTPRQEPGASAFASDLVVARRAPGAGAFAPPLRVHEDAPGSRGFEGITADVEGVAVAWLESGATARTRVAHVGAGGGGSAIPVATLDAQSCPCCRVAVAADPRGRIGLLWRDETAEAVRDMRFAWAPRAGEEATSLRVHRDDWQLAACPHRGGALAFMPDGRAVVAWYTEGPDGAPSLLLASGDASGFDPPLPLHDDATLLPDRVALAIDASGHGLVLFERRTAARSEIALRSVHVADRRVGPVQVISRGIQASHPVVVAAPQGGFVAAWQEEAFPTLRTVVVWVFADTSN